MTELPVVRVQRVMPATPEVVFDEWLDPEALADWMCPRPARCVAISVEPRVGGRVRFDVDNSGSLVLITGQFLDIDRPTVALHVESFGLGGSDGRQRRQRRVRACRRRPDPDVHRAFAAASGGVRGSPSRVDGHRRPIDGTASAGVMRRLWADALTAAVGNRDQTLRDPSVGKLPHVKMRAKGVSLPHVSVRAW